MNDFIEENSQNRAQAVTSGQGPLVAILMGTKNGERFLAQQLDSLEAQTHQNWVLIASDDGSTDDTLRILKAYQAKWPAGKLIIKEGPKQGFCANFLSMACDPGINADYYAFCDQDDVWLPAKLEIGIRHICSHQVFRDQVLPYLYCGRTIYVDENLIGSQKSPLFTFFPSFRNALVQSIAGGNTMIFNLSAKKILEKAGLLNSASHDWWLYMLITGVGGKVFYDPNPYVLYRQHRNSLVGNNTSIRARARRMMMLLDGTFRSSIGNNLDALHSVSHMLGINEVDILQMFERMRNETFKNRFRVMEICGLYRQTWKGTIVLCLRYPKAFLKHHYKK